MDDFVINVRQIWQYPDVVDIALGDVLLLQRGPGGEYFSVTPQEIMNAGLINGGWLNFATNFGPQWGGTNGPRMFWDGSVFQFSGQVNVTTLAADNAVLVAGQPVALQSDLDAQIAAILANSVTSFNFRTGAIQLTTDDVLRAGGAPIWNPNFGGMVTAPTPWDFRANSNQVATTAWVQGVLGAFVCSGAIVTSFNGRGGAVVLTTADVNAAFAASTAPDWPSAPSPALGDASNRIATTAFVDEGLTDLQDLLPALIDQELTKANFAPLNSPNFTGNPTAPTAAPGSSTGQLATTAFVMAAIVAGTTGVASFNTRTGAVVLTLADVTNAGGAPSANPALTGTATAPTAALHNSSTEIATTAYVQGELAALPTAGVTSFNGRGGAVVLSTADITGAGGAPIASPTFTGNPQAPTAGTADSSTSVATTAFVHAAIATLGTTVQSFNGRTGAVSLLANDVSAAGGALLAGPAFSGVPTAPTATLGTNTTQLATCAFVLAELTAMPAAVTSFNTRTGAITLLASDLTAVGGALLASPSFTGAPHAPTPPAASNDTTIATTAFVGAAVAAGAVTSFNSRTGAVTLTANDLSAVGGALLASPTFSGVPAGPTAAPGASTTQLATTAFVAAALATAGGVTSFNGRAGTVTLTAADITGAGGLTIATELKFGGRLVFLSATALNFAPFKGSLIRINGVTYQIPSGGIAGLANTNVYVNGVAGQNLGNNITYWVYCWVNGGVLTADFSTTNHQTSSTAGNVGTEIKTGDDTRSLIGLIYTGGSGSFVNAPATRYVRTWFNRQRLALNSPITNFGPNSSTAWAPSSISVSWVGWAGEAVAVLWGNTTQNSASAINYLGIGIDVLNAVAGTYVAASIFNLNADYAQTCFYNNDNLSEGYHTAQGLMMVTGGAMTGVQCMVSGTLG